MVEEKLARKMRVFRLGNLKFGNNTETKTRALSFSKIKNQLHNIKARNENYQSQVDNKDEWLKNSYLLKKSSKLDSRSVNPLKPESHSLSSKLIPFKFDKKHRAALTKEQKVNFLKFNSRLKKSRKIAKDSDEDAFSDFINDGKKAIADLKESQDQAISNIIRDISRSISPEKSPKNANIEGEVKTAYDDEDQVIIFDEMLDK